MGRFGIYFQKEGEASYLLPVNPETLPVARSVSNGEYNVMGIGPIMIPRIPNQRKVSISSFFPGRPFSGMLVGQRGFVPPSEFIDFFEGAMKNREIIVYHPIRYYENGEAFSGGDDEGFQCLVTQFDTEERGGETGDFYFTLEIVEYRDYAPQQLVFQPVEEDSEQVPLAASVEPTRTIPPGQIVVGSLCIINGRYYADSYGGGSYGNGNGRTVKVSRIVDLSRADPYHVTTENGGALGWTSADCLQVMG